MPPAEPPRWWALSLPKHGNSEEEYEDAWALDAALGRFAVADGASETSFSGRWAQLLAEGFLAASRPPDLASWLAESRRAWSGEVMGLELPWYADMKRAEGAFATLLGVGLRTPQPGKPGKWRAAAVGDSCLVRVRPNGVVQSFPVQKSADFNNQPHLIGSRDETEVRPEYGTGPLLVGDRLFLMTDALAQWFLHAHESGGRPWEAVADVLSESDPDAAFAAWVAELREHEDLRNDDVTLLAVEMDSVSEEQRP